MRVSRGRSEAGSQSTWQPRAHSILCSPVCRHEDRTPSNHPGIPTLPGWYLSTGRRPPAATSPGAQPDGHFETCLLEGRVHTSEHRQLTCPSSQAGARRRRPGLEWGYATCNSTRSPPPARASPAHSTAGQLVLPLNLLSVSRGRCSRRAGTRADLSRCIKGRRSGRVGSLTEHTLIMIARTLLLTGTLPPVSATVQPGRN